ncbi:MAG: ABC transporter ATP-binding protein [Ruminiclostridium sp.]|nr:ABC transporter ATP-binding protein [Ruminiclostridium sp.]
MDQNEEEILGKAYDSKLMKRLLAYAKNYWKNFTAAIFMLLGSTLSELARPYLLKVAIDDKIKNGDIPGLGVIGVVYISLIAAGFLFNYIQMYALNQAGQSIIYNIRQQVFSHLQKMKLSFFDKNPVGRLVTRVTNDTETLNDMYTNVLVTLLKDVLILIGTIAIMLRMHSTLALVTLSVTPVVILVTLFFRIKVREVYRSVRTTLARINSAFSENITGMRIIQLFSKEKENFSEFKKVNRSYYDAGIKEIVTFGIFRPVIEMLSYLSIAAIIWYGGGKVVEGALQFGVLYAFINYVSLFFQPINDLAEKYNILQASMAASERIFQVLDTEAEKDGGTIRFDNDCFNASIEFRNVWFAYKNRDWVLKDVSFQLPAGKTIAIVGATGAGKTSIINLLNRFYEIQQGDILINGINIKNVAVDSLRKSIGVVLQDVFLFSGTIKENIKLNEENISDEKVMKAAEFVNAGGFIEALPHKYEEEVKERGAAYSSGQRQLLAFARALAFDPPILVLDEATASIDTGTELLIQDALAKLTRDRTTIVIAHRLSTIQHADMIIVLHKGRIREMGNHQELLAERGFYYKLYKLQYNDDSAAKTHVPTKFR